jgi:HD-GYP domain-containing protein (c-di-GMP phosphodiesterase class II)
VPEKRLRLAELAAGLSVVSDLSRGLEDGQGIRAGVLAMHVADLLGLDTDDRTTLLWISLLRFAGWTTRAADTAAALGDDLLVGAALTAAELRDRSGLVATAVATVGRRPRGIAGFVREAPAAIAAHQVASSETSQWVAARFGLPSRVVRGLGQVFERWDGSGTPGHLRGTEIDVAVRVWQVAHVAELVASERGPDAVRSVLRRRSSRTLDATIAGAVADAIHDLLHPEANGVEALLALEPQPHRLTDQAGVDDLLPLFGMIADFKAPFLRGHSDRVALLAGAAAAAAGRSAHDVTLVRRAGWLHDVGRVAVSSASWGRDEVLSDAELERMRAHPLHTARALAHTPGLAGLADVACAHHERLDGSGYPRGLSGAQFTPLAALLAAADAYVSAGEARPHRPARPPAEQAFVILGLADDGRLPHEAVDAVIAAVNNGSDGATSAPAS